MYRNRQPGLSLDKYASKNLRDAINSFCDQINNSEADLYIIMAQKAVCLIKLLIALGKIKSKLKGKFIASSAIDFAVESLDGLKIIIIDDIMISGSSMASLANKLYSRRVPEENVEFIALARNINYQTMQFGKKGAVSKLHCAIDVEDAVCIELSYEISHLLAYYGKPYDSDFFACEIALRENSNLEYSELMNPNYWIMYETTNEAAWLGGFDTFTMFPRAEIKNKLWDALGVEFDNLVHLKIRLSICKYPNGEYSLAILPMALFNEIGIEDFNRLFNKILDEDSVKLIQNQTLNAKVRMLQFYISYALYKIYLDGFSLHSINLPSLEDLFVYFADSASIILEALNKIPLPKNHTEYFIAQKIPVQTQGFDQKLVLEDIANTNDELGNKINDFLLSPFVWWYKEHEIPSRQQLSFPVKNYIIDHNEIDGLTHRLSDGFSLNALIGFIASLKDIINCEYAVSVFLDRAIDEGHVVPFNYCDEPSTDSDIEDKTLYICRKYRHGEDLPFGYADHIRLLYFLLKLNNHMCEQDPSMRYEKIAQVTFHKMIVLFYQLGLKKGGIFNRFLGFDNEPFLQERFCIHGIVEAIRLYTGIKGDQPHIYANSENDDGIQFTKFLVGKLSECKFIKLENLGYLNSAMMIRIDSDSISKEFAANEIETPNGKISKMNCLSRSIKNSIDLIASVIATWYVAQKKHKKGRNIFKQDITALTSCSDSFTFTSAIATEIHYFSRYFESNATPIIDLIIQGDYSHTVSEFKYGSTSQALYRGKDKFGFYKDQRVGIVIDRVQNYLDSNPKKAQESIFWRNIWPETRKTIAKMSPYQNMFICYLYFYSACYDWLTRGGLIMRKGYQKICKDDYWKPVEDFEYDGFKEWFCLFDELDQEDNLSKRAELFKMELKNHLIFSEDSLLDFEKRIADRTDSYTIYYNSVLFFGINEANIEVCRNFFREVWNELDEDVEKTHLNIVEMIDCDLNNIPRFAVFYECTIEQQNAEHSFNMLLNVYSILLNIACKKAYMTSAVLVPDLPPKAVFSYNLKRNIPKNINEFYTKFCVGLDPAIRTGSNLYHRLDLIYTRNISDEGKKAFESRIQREFSFFEGLERSSLNISGLNAVRGYSHYMTNVLENRATEYTVDIIYGEKKVGLGFLFRMNGNVFCITCQHLLNNNRDKSMFKARLNNKKEYQLELLNEYINRSSRSATEEILVFSISIGRDMINNIVDFLTEDKCIKDIKEVKNENLSCYVLPEHEPDGKHIYSIANQVSMIRRNFICIKANEQFEEGYSGAIWMSEGGKLVGMHVRHVETDLLRSDAVPAWLIIQELKNIQREDKQNGILL